MVHARNKGKAAETEFINKFQSLFPETIRRNLEQVRSGGSDVEGCDPFVIELKRVEKLDLNSWWRQVQLAARQKSALYVQQCGHTLNSDGSGFIPLVGYRQSRQPWRFLLPATLIVAKSETFIIVDEETFIKFVSEHYE